MVGGGWGVGGSNVNSQMCVLVSDGRPWSNMGLPTTHSLNYWLMTTYHRNYTTFTRDTTPDTLMDYNITRVFICTHFRMCIYCLSLRVIFQIDLDAWKWLKSPFVGHQGNYRVYDVQTLPSNEVPSKPNTTPEYGRD